MCVGECKCVCVIGEIYKIQYIMHIIIIIKMLFQHEYHNNVSKYHHSSFSSIYG